MTAADELADMLAMIVNHHTATEALHGRIRLYGPNAADLTNAAHATDRRTNQIARAAAAHYNNAAGQLAQARDELRNAYEQVKALERDAEDRRTP